MNFANRHRIAAVAGLAAATLLITAGAANATSAAPDHPHHGRGTGNFSGVSYTTDMAASCHTVQTVDELRITCDDIGVKVVGDPVWIGFQGASSAHSKYTATIYNNSIPGDATNPQTLKYDIEDGWHLMWYRDTVDALDHSRPLQAPSWFDHGTIWGLGLHAPAGSRNLTQTTTVVVTLSAK